MLVKQLLYDWSELTELLTNHVAVKSGRLQLVWQVEFFLREFLCLSDDFVWQIQVDLLENQSFGDKFASLLKQWINLFD